MAPELSVVIPAYDGPERLRACLESLGDQTAPTEAFEVIVVVRAADGAVEEMVSGIAAPYALRVVQQSASGRGAATNLGVANAEGRFILVLDGNAIAAPGLVAAHLTTQQDDGPVAGIGLVEPAISDSVDPLAQAQAELSHEHYERLARRSPTLCDANAGNLSLARAAYLEAGGLAEDVPAETRSALGDLDLYLRLYERGLRFVFIPEAATVVGPATTWREMARDAETRGHRNVAFYRRSPAILPWLELGGLDSADRSGIAVRLALALRIPPVALGTLGPLAPGRRAARSWFRFVRRHAYWHGVRRAADSETWHRLRRGVAILMYHGIGDRGEAPTRYVVPVDRFERQMKWLKRRRYNVIRLEEYLGHLTERRLPPAKTVVITLDDGYVDNLVLGRPILEQLGLPATIFLVSAGGDRNAWSTSGGVEGRPLMGLDDARRALGGVISFGAHTRTHPKLPDIPLTEAEQEIVRSKQELEAALGVPVTTFAYPYGQTDEDVRDIVARAGFTGACGVVPGRNYPSADVFALRRVEIFGHDRMPRFALTMWLGDVGRRRRRA